MRDALVEVMRAAGIEVVTDADEGQRVLVDGGTASRRTATSFQKAGEGDLETIKRAIQ